eukprot:g3397.t1
MRTAGDDTTTTGLGTFNKYANKLFKRIESEDTDSELTIKVLVAFYTFLKNTVSIHRACHTHDEWILDKYCEHFGILVTSPKHYAWRKIENVKGTIKWYNRELAHHKNVTIEEMEREVAKIRAKEERREREKQELYGMRAEEREMKLFVRREKKERRRREKQELRRREKQELRRRKKQELSALRAEKRKMKQFVRRKKKKKMCQPDEAYGRLCLLMDLRLINIHLIGDDVPVQNLAQVHEYCKNEYGKAFSERDIIDAVGRLDFQDRQQLHSRLHDHSWYYSSRFILINNKLS